MTIESPYGRNLPIFPELGYSLPITTDRVERAAEKLMDRADQSFMAGNATQSQYDKWVRALNNWADGYYAVCGR